MMVAEILVVESLELKLGSYGLLHIYVILLGVGLHLHLNYIYQF